MEYGCRSELWAAYPGWMWGLSGCFYDQWYGGQPEYLLLYYCPCEQVCSARECAGLLEYYGQPGECGLSHARREEGAHRSEFQPDGYDVHGPVQWKEFFDDAQWVCGRDVCVVIKQGAATGRPAEGPS